MAALKGQTQSVSERLHQSYKFQIHELQVQLQKFKDEAAAAKQGKERDLKKQQSKATPELDDL